MSGQTLEVLAPRVDRATAEAVLSYRHWQQRDPNKGLGNPAAYRELARGLLQQGVPVLAHEVLVDGLEHYPRDVRLRQQQGLALARTGLTEEAHRLALALRDEGLVDEETLGLLGRIHKDLALNAQTPAERTRELELAYRSYADAYRRTGGFWTGINAATTACLLGHTAPARELAQAVLDECQAEAAGTKDHDYWLLATLGEACLVLGRWTEAETWYREAHRKAGNRFGDLGSTRRNAHLLLDALDQDPTWLDGCLPMPAVVVFVGHMMDLPNRPFPRFPPHLEQRVAAAIRERLERLDGRIGFASAAQGSDILFHEAVDSLDGESHVILPFEEDEFRKESIDGAGVDWYGRFRRVLARAEETVILSQSRMERDPVSFDYANLVVEGLAISRAKELGSRLVPLAVWNGQAGDGPGGTADVIARWRSVGREIEIIDLRALDGDRTASITVPPPRAQIGPRPAQAQDRPRIMALLFGDVAKFSELAERHILPFVEHFLGGIAHLIEAEPSRAPVGRNTWGDGLFLVFDSVRQAGLFALDLCDWVAGMDWEREGLRPGLTLRIGLHAGPVHACVDPLTGLPSFFGTHISRAARIEPITPPGHVYASQAFAALAALDQISEFRCDYVRQVIWAKQYGTFPTYLVRRTFSGADSNPIHSNASGGG